MWVIHVIEPFSAAQQEGMFSRAKSKVKEEPAATPSPHEVALGSPSKAASRRGALQPGVSVSIEKPYGGFVSNSGYEMRRRPTRYVLRCRRLPGMTARSACWAHMPFIMSMSLRSCLFYISVMANT